MVEDPDIERIIVQNPDIRDACTKLIARANEHGGEDNVTAVLIKIEDVDGAPGDDAAGGRRSAAPLEPDLDGETTSPGAGSVKPR